MTHDRSGPIKPKMGIDLDGCVYDFDYGARVTLRHHGIDIPVEESTHWGNIEELIPPEAWSWLWNDHTACRETFRCAPPYEGAIRALRQLQQVVQLCIITHRPLKVADVTLRRLADDRIAPYAVIHAQHADKSTIMPDCIAYVEDRVENVIEIAHGSPDHVPVFMPRRVYNRELHHPPRAADAAEHIIPFDDWKEVVAWTTSLLRRRL